MKYGEEFETKNLPVLKRVDFSRNTGLPPMPKSLIAILVFIRLLPAITQLVAGIFILTNPDSTALTLWIENTYGTRIEYLAYWMIAFAFLSFMWSFTGRWRYNMILRVFGNIIFTFPSLLYIVLADYYIFAISGSGRQVAALYTSLYVTQLTLYTMKAMLAVWFESIRKIQNK